MNLTEYEQQMVTAGFIPIESLDDDFQEYLKTTRHHEEQFDYNSWKAARERLDELGKFYEANIAPFYLPDAPPMDFQQRQSEENYWREVNHLECSLGY